MSAWSRDRVGLVGDAAYCPSLLAGAGSAFAMLGAYILAGELKRAEGNHAAAFAAYEGRLRPFIEEHQRSAARFARAFAPKTALGLFVRNAVLNLMRFAPLAGSLVLAPHVLERIRSRATCEGGLLAGPRAGSHVE